MNSPSAPPTSPAAAARRAPPIRRGGARPPRSQSPGAGTPACGARAARRGGARRSPRNPGRPAPFARDHDHHPRAVALRPVQESPQRVLRLMLAQPVQIDGGIGADLAARELLLQTPLQRHQRRRHFPWRGAGCRNGRRRRRGAGSGAGFEGTANRSGKRLPARRATLAATVSQSSISSSLKRRNLGRGGDGGAFVTSGSPP